MSEGLTPDEIEDFYADTINPVEPVKINPEKITVNVMSETSFSEPISVVVKNSVNEDEANTTDIDSLAASIKEMEMPVDSVPITMAIEETSSLAEEFATARAGKKAKKSNHVFHGAYRVWRRRLGTAAVILVSIFALTLVGMRITGFRTFTVMSGSMEPEYPVGAMIYVKPVDYKSLKVGDVISFVANNDKTVVTHRIDEIKVDENDSEVWRFKTKGDANNTADAGLVHYKNVIGTPIIAIPYIGYLAHNIQQPPGIYIALVVGTLLLAWTFLPGTLEGRRKTARNTAL
ncbi:signal peptidase I [Candidatus Saccharibacteria bacterium]|nr:signal peptidase I [Candidatus Saccharibacteria bacterium]